MKFPKINLPSLSKEKKKELLMTSLIFAAVCVSAALVLSGIFALLSAKIDKNASADMLAVMPRIFPADRYEPVEFELEEASGVTAIYGAYIGEELSGYCISTASRERYPTTSTAPSSSIATDLCCPAKARHPIPQGRKRHGKAKGEIKVQNQTARLKKQNTKLWRKVKMRDIAQNFCANLLHKA